MDIDKYDVLSLNIDEIKNILCDIGEKPYRANQIFKWCHNSFAESFNEMSNIPKGLKNQLNNIIYFPKMNIAERFLSKKDNTIKYLFEIENNNIIESVFMRYEYGNAVCISTQAGCKMGCSFCASAIGGFERNLTAGEMLLQVYKMQKDSGLRVSNIVLMGSGEPLDNFDNTIKFIELVSSKDGINIGQRHITVSTCGIADKIYELAKKKFQINLAVSLHAPNDAIRRKIMPIALKYSFREVLEAAKEYAYITKRRVTFEYALISGINDSDECARELSFEMKGFLSHVNLIPVNNVAEKNYVKSSEKKVKHFADILRKNGVNTTIRRRLGSDINAACGQLRRGYKKPDEV